MKSLQTLKKFAVMVISAMMVLTTFAMPTFAATVEIDGFEAGVTPTAYKIASVNTEGNITRVDGVDDKVIKDLENPTTDEILKLAANTPTALASKEGTVDGAKVKISGLDPGIYLVKFAATANVKYVYNPIIISVNKDGEQVVDGLDNYNGETAKVKKSTVPFEKVVERTDSKIDADAKNPDTGKNANAANSNVTNEGALVNADPQSGDDGNRGDTAQKGDTVSFRINTKVPYYADNFFTDTANTTVKVAPQFQVYDTLDGLTLNQNSIVVYANNNFTTALVKDTHYTLEANASGFTVTMKETAIKTYRGQDLEVRYSAVVNDNAARVNFNPDTNTAGCKYSNNPDSNTLAETENRTTYHYKFTINGQIEGNNGEYNREVIKVGTDEHGNHVFLETTDGKMTEKGWDPLDGVTFKLYDSEKNKVVRDNVRSADGGVLKGMDQLDAGVYYLKEDQEQDAFKEGGAYADKKYVANTNWIKIEIKAKLLDDGRLDSYMVLVEDQCVGHYKADYKTAYDAASGTKVVDVEKGTDGFYEIEAGAIGEGAKIQKKHNITKPDNTVLTGDWAGDYGVAADIRNSHVGTLPSTGGMGTVLFTVGGIAIMALAIFLLFGGKKKGEQK